MSTTWLQKHGYTTLKTFAPLTTRLMVEVFREKQSEHPFDWDCACEECMRKLEEFD